MKSRIRQYLMKLRYSALVPALQRLEAIETRLDHQARRLDEIETMLQTTEARTSTVTERSNGLVESQTRIARRIDDIERILGARTGDR